MSVSYQVDHRTGERAEPGLGPTCRPRHMIIEKSKVIEVLLSRGQDARAAWVAKSLPDEVDTVRNASLLATLRVRQGAIDALGRWDAAIRGSPVPVLLPVGPPCEQLGAWEPAVAANNGRALSAMDLQAESGPPAAPLKSSMIRTGDGRSIT